MLTASSGLAWNPVPGATELLARLKEAGKRIFVVSNNSTKSSSEYVKKLEKLGFRGLTEENIVGAGMVTAHELAYAYQSPYSLIIGPC